jgi:hypothetical protein
VVGADVPRNAASHEQVRQRVDDVDGFEPAGDPAGQALVGELIADGEPAELAPLMGDQGCAPRRSRRTRRDCGARPWVGCRRRRSARDDCAAGAGRAPSAPRVARSARPACR